MRSVRVAVVLMLGFGVALAVGNLWTAIVRSMIPRAVMGTITNTETRFEKHKGKDDVHLIWLEGTCIQVDRSVFLSVRKGSSIEKERFSRTMIVDSQPIALDFSRDAKGMLPAMVLVLAVLAATGWYSYRLIKIGQRANQFPSLDQGASASGQDL